jgi:LuxR family maltose regulon positive regulatory protein
MAISSTLTNWAKVHGVWMGRNSEQLSQNEPLLRTKIFVPAARKDVIQRPRLIEALQSNLLQQDSFTRKLTLISAPAGYGKTTLASQWLGEAGLPSAWLSLEAGENDASRFLTYLLAAVQRLSPQLGASMRGMLMAPQRPPTEILLTPLINELAALEEAMLIVLDDYHVIHGQPVHEILNFLVDHLPPNVHLVILSREDPPLPLHRLNARRQMLGLRQAELSFSAEEAVDFFQRISGLEVTPDQAARLTRRTEGWVTGLQLAALSMRTALDQEAFIASFTGSNRFVLDYLFEEVFNIQPKEIRSFLLQTAVLERVCAGLADAVTGGEGSQALLEELEHANFFIVPLDQSRQWYRYHRLFADLLRHRLGQSSLDVKKLHELAGRWHAQHGYLEEAIEHALQGEHWEPACRWIAEAGGRCLRRGEIFTLLGWCRRVPEAVLLKQSDRALTFIWALILAGQLDSADRVLEQLKTYAHDETARVRGEIAAAEAYLSRSRGDVQKTIERSKTALSLIPEDDRGNRGTVALNLGLTTWHLGRLDETQSALEEALEDTRAARNHYGHQTALLFMARTLGARGQLVEAHDYLEQALTIGENVPTAVLVHTDLAALAFERNRVDCAWDHLDRAEATAEATHSTEFRTACAVQRALFHLGLGHAAAAARALEPALALLHEQDFAPTTQARIAACQAQIALVAGDLEQVQVILEAIPLPHDAQTFFRFIDLNRARLLRARGELEQALRALSAAAKQADDAGWGYASHAIRLLQALSSQDIDYAIDCLKPSLQQAEDAGFLRIFLSEGDGILDTLKEAARRGIAPEYVGRILAAHEVAAGISPGSEKLLEALSDRELEVLRLVAAGLTNREIAEQLVVSLGTAKAHIHHIFGKLGVNSRTQAAARAHDLGLI